MHTIAFKNKQEVAENTFLYTFSRPEGYVFDAGQYATVLFGKDALYQDARGNARAFSFASAPYEEDLGFMMRQSQTGFKKNIHTLEEGETVNLSPAVGRCTLSYFKQQKKLIILTAGVGITPIRSILRQIIHTKAPLECLLFNSNRTPESTPELDWLERMNKEHDHITVVNMMTDMERAKLPWNGYVGYIDQTFLEERIRDEAETNYFVVGASGFIESMRKNLLNMAISEEKIFFDNFG